MPQKMNAGASVPSTTCIPMLPSMERTGGMRTLSELGTARQPFFDCICERSVDVPRDRLMSHLATPSARPSQGRS
ncbi:MAG: hypothetical protein NVS3B26_12540 [Mycobacteriales bacterium]